MLLERGQCLATLDYSVQNPITSFQLHATRSIIPDPALLTGQNRFGGFFGGHRILIL